MAFCYYIRRQGQQNNEKYVMLRLRVTFLIAVTQPTLGCKEEKMMGAPQASLGSFWSNESANIICHRIWQTLNVQ